MKQSIKPVGLMIIMRLKNRIEHITNCVLCGTPVTTQMVARNMMVCAKCETTSSSKKKS